MNDLLAMMELVDRLRTQESAGFVVLVIDTEIDQPISVYGPCTTPEAALVLAGEFDRDPDSGVRPADGSPGWKHIILPIFEVPESC